MNRGFFSLSLHAERMILRIGGFSHFLCTRKESDKENALKLFLLLGRKSFRIKKKKLHASPVRIQRTAGSAVGFVKAKGKEIQNAPDGSRHCRCKKGLHHTVRPPLRVGDPEGCVTLCGTQ